MRINFFENRNNLSVSGKSSISQFCPNLKRLFTIFRYNESNVLRTIFNGQYLESVKVWCGSRHLDEKENLEAYSPKSFHQLKMYNFAPLTLIAWKNSFHLIERNILTIEKYKKLGIIKEFGVEEYNISS